MALSAVVNATVVYRTAGPSIVTLGSACAATVTVVDSEATPPRKFVAVRVNWKRLPGCSSAAGTVSTGCVTPGYVSLARRSGTAPMASEFNAATAQ